MNPGVVNVVFEVPVGQQGSCKASPLELGMPGRHSGFSYWLCDMGRITVTSWLDSFVNG